MYGARQKGASTLMGSITQTGGIEANTEGAGRGRFPGSFEDLQAPTWSAGYQGPYQAHEDAASASAAMSQQRPWMVQIRDQDQQVQAQDYGHNAQYQHPTASSVPAPRLQAAQPASWTQPQASLTQPSLTQPSPGTARQASNAERGCVNAERGWAVVERFPQLGNVNYQDLAPDTLPPVPPPIATPVPPPIQTPVTPVAAPAASKGPGKGGGSSAPSVSGSRGKPEDPGDAPEDTPPTLDQQLHHAKWNVRAYAYQHLACAIYSMGASGACSEQEAEWARYLQAVTAGMAESNVVALDKALNAAVQFLQYAPLPLCEHLASAAAEVTHLRFVCLFVVPVTARMFTDDAFMCCRG